MGSQVWVVATLLVSIVLIVLTIVKLKFHPFLALLLASFFVGAMMGMSPLDMVNAIESGIGGTLGFLAAVIGLGTILGKMMEVSGAAERIGIALQRCRWLSADVIMVLVGLICGITLFVEVGVVLLIPLAFSIAKKTNTSLLKLAIPLCTALMAVHCVVPPHPAALFVTNKLGADVGTVIVYGLMVGLVASLVGGPLFLKLLGNRLPFKPVPAEFSDLKVREEHTLPSLGATLFTVLLPIGLMLVKTIAELNMAKEGSLYTLLEFIGNPITAMFIAVFVAYYLLGIRQHMSMGAMLTHTEHGFGSIANIFADYRRGRRVQRHPQNQRTGGLTGAYSLESAHASYPSRLAGGAGAACRRRLRHGRDDGRHGDSRADAAALSERESGDHHHCYRFRRHWLHDRHRFSLLAGEAILRRNPE